MKLLSTVVLFSLSFVAMGQDAVPLKRSPKEGDSATYKLTVETEIQGMAIKFMAKVIEKIVKIGADGSYSQTSEQSEQTLVMNGQETPMPAAIGGLTTTEYAATGHMGKMEGDQVDSTAYRMGAIQSFIWPTTDVKVGDKWTATVKADKDKGIVETECNYEILAFETLGTRKTVKVAYSCTEKEGSDPASSKGTVWIDLSNGLMVKSDSMWTNAPIAGQLVTGKVTVEIVD